MVLSLEACYSELLSVWPLICTWHGALIKCRSWFKSPGIKSWNFCVSNKFPSDAILLTTTWEANTCQSLRKFRKTNLHSIFKICFLFPQSWSHGILIQETSENFTITTSLHTWESHSFRRENSGQPLLPLSSKLSREQEVLFWFFRAQDIKLGHLLFVC